MNKLRKYDYNKDTLEKLVKESCSYAEVARKLGMHSKGGNYNTLRRNIKKWNLDTSHFVGRGWSKGKKIPDSRTSLKMYLDNLKPITSWKLKNKLIEAGIKKNECEICGISEWNHKPIACQLHHKNGNNEDNNLENLQMLCPNCHSQTDSYAGKNLRTAEPKRKLSKEELSKVNGHANISCRKVTRPSYEQFLIEFEELDRNYCAMGRKYGVSDKAIRKWIKSYEKYGV